MSLAQKKVTGTAFGSDRLKKMGRFNTEDTKGTEHTEKGTAFRKNPLQCYIIVKA
jgi:hypothetical protein